MSSILQPGRNCWRIERASRLALLIDGEAYFAALRRSLLAARREVLILGWDFDGRIELVKEDPGDGAPTTLLELLNHCVRRCPELHVHVLLWDFAVLYALEREPLPSYRLRRMSHERVHVAFDDTVPFGGSHHQKLVCVDGVTAFSGGLDLSDARWDTPAHRPGDARRRLVSGRPYGPFHDVQMAVEGDVAAALGALARERWRVATGETLAAPPAQGTAWPDGVAAELEEVPVAIARTRPPGGPPAAVREVEALYLDAIAAAREVIYLENQYFTSERLGRALAQRLGEDDGPEVVLVMPRTCAGWLEEGTMGLLRGRFLRRLAEADRHRRLGAWCPLVGDGEEVMVHAKVCVVDDRLCMVSSSNFTKRSMGVDTECDLALEARPGDEATRAFVAGVRERLLGEHLGLAPEQVREAHAAAGSWHALVEGALGERRLEAVERDAPHRPALESVVERVGDPQAPLESADLVEEFRDRVEEHRARISGAAGLLGLAAAVVALAFAWQYTPLAELVSVERVRAWLADMRASAFVPALLVAAYVAGGLVSMPITVLNAATVIVFGPWLGFAYAMAGSLVSACVLFFAGRALGAQVIRRFSSGLVHRVAHAVGRRGFLAVLTVRMVPVAPFTVINVVAGAMPVRLRDFVLGTLAGMLPGTAVLAAFGDRVEKVLTDPSTHNLVVLGLILAAWLALTAVMHRAVEALRARAGASGRGEGAAGGVGNDGEAG